jgi:hypothetical protein
MFSAQPNILDVFESQITLPGSAISDALNHLSQLASGRGTCMCLEHPDHGITVIADAAWHHDGAATVQNRHKHSVFSLRGHEGFDTISVLVGVADADELGALQSDCAIAAAALGLVASVGAATAMTKPHAQLMAA